jgi:hypothetical protein
MTREITTCDICGLEIDPETDIWNKIGLNKTTYTACNDCYDDICSYVADISETNHRYRQDPRA